MNEDSDGEKSSGIGTPADPVEDPLKWLDDGLSDLSGYIVREFDLSMQFDIRLYVDVLADTCVADSRRRSDSREPEQTPHNKLRHTAANTLAPEEGEWGKW